MAYLAQTLVTRSWYLSGIIARNLQQPTGDQITDGLSLLNALLDYKQIETDLVPYYTYFEMPLIGGQEYYFLPNVANVESVTFNIGVVRYPMESIHRRAYFGSVRVDNIQTLPFNWNFNRGEGGGTLSLYFLPQDAYPAKFMVKIFLNDVSLNTDLTTALSPLSTGFIASISVTNGGSGYTQVPTITISGNGGASAFATLQNGSITSITVVNPGSGYTVAPTITITGNGIGATAQANVTHYNFLQTANAGYDTSYIEYLRYALAEMMCGEYGVSFSQQNAMTLKKYERKLMYMSPPDVSMIKRSILTEGTSLNFGDVNIGQGYRPS